MAEKRKAQGADSGAGLIPDVEAVEIKVTVRSDQELRGLRALALDEDSAEVRVVFFYDTPKLALFDAGVVLRARLVKGDDDDSTVKVRPVEPKRIPPGWLEVAGFKLEADRTGKKVVRSASLTALQKRDEINSVAEGQRPIQKLFTKEQQRFLAELSPKPVDFDTLRALGPIRVLRWKTRHKGFPWDLTSEEWRLPDGDDLLEVSIKVEPEEAEKAQQAFDEHLRGLGIDPGGAQQTKTRTALAYFASALGKSR